MTFVGLDHVQVAAPRGSEAAARRFYAEMLGLEELPKPTALAGRGGLWFRCGAQQLHIGIDSDFRPAKKAHPALRVNGRAALDALRRRLESFGAPVESADLELEGLARFFVDDPFGNRVEVLAIVE